MTGKTAGDAEAAELIELRRLAFVRFGDKGDLSNMVVAARSPEYWPELLAELTPERVQAEFAAMARGPVRRYLVPELHLMNFVIERALGGGVTRSLALDRHGKSRSGYAGGILVRRPLNPGHPHTGPA